MMKIGQKHCFKKNKYELRAKAIMCDVELQEKNK